jgi:hypothetical protein
MEELASRPDAKLPIVHMRHVVALLMIGRVSAAAGVPLDRYRGPNANFVRVADAIIGISRAKPLASKQTLRPEAGASLMGHEPPTVLDRR